MWACIHWVCQQIDWEENSSVSELKVSTNSEVIPEETAHFRGQKKSHSYERTDRA